MRRITKYTTAQDNDSRGLDKRVTTLIEMGYQPFGGPYSAFNGRSVTLCQALVKYEGDEGESPKAETPEKAEVKPAAPETTPSAPTPTAELKEPEAPKAGETSRLQLRPSPKTPPPVPQIAPAEATPPPPPPPPPPPAPQPILETPSAAAPAAPQPILPYQGHEEPPAEPPTIYVEPLD